MSTNVVKYTSVRVRNAEAVREEAKAAPAKAVREELSGEEKRKIKFYLEQSMGVVHSTASNAILARQMPITAIAFSITPTQLWSHVAGARGLKQRPTAKLQRLWEAEMWNRFCSWDLKKEITAAISWRCITFAPDDFTLTVEPTEVKVIYGANFLASASLKRVDCNIGAPAHLFADTAIFNETLRTETDKAFQAGQFDGMRTTVLAMTGAVMTTAASGPAAGAGALLLEDTMPATPAPAKVCPRFGDKCRFGSACAH